ncbi:thymidine phosphorylase [Pimephales promelas]|uniref:thymidine phosphorylase n=1 Tax=Pimephales promelas TaxID=90988 RepID=UPI001955C21C|nr:thymidine phosphorylase [Pimephales promelas]KAG1952660.1 thymidine phosphorylase [Pimephales promelas]KAG1952661.1 thymidine phosphorylase [Pimephales promelas]KAG1952662.1 thymidine phosphorylase [Pimephales promelas]KAG1952663.1 thymidine phosphorylase [Pimephales promelas]
MSSNDNTKSFPELIKLKRDGDQLSPAEIRTFVQGVTSQTIQKSQIGAMLMAIWQQNMTDEETLALTREMMNSGDTLKWPEEWWVVDKHSTGGVGDKVSLPLAPALAACGCKVPMISGRGLAHTGGTLDKLESIPGFNVSQSIQQVEKILQDVGCCIVGQTESLVPADRVLYAIRDATSTVDSLPLITGSIISKKGAEGLSALVLDVKFGRAALYKDLDSARKLAQSLVTAGNKLGVKTRAVLTRMDAPIGQTVGNAVEVCEALECLKGRGPDDLTELVTILGGHLLDMCSPDFTVESGTKEIALKLKNGEALEKFQAMLEAQGVSAEVARSLCSYETDYFQHMSRAAHQTELKVLDDGAVLDIDGLALAEVLHKLGAGLTKSEDKIDHSVGAEILVKMGQQVQKGESWIRIHHKSQDDLSVHQSVLQKALVIGNIREYKALSRVAEFI